MRIMLVDHSPDFGVVLRIGLKAVGYDLTAFLTAGEALKALGRREEFGLALVEYSGDGREFLNHYREVDALLPVVVLTSLPTTASAVEFLRGGPQAAALDYIEKPAPNLIERLTGIIERHFGRVAAGDWAIDRRLRQAFYRGRPIYLTNTALAMFTYFLLHPYEEVPHEALWHAVRGEWLERKRAVYATRAHMARLRERLEEIAGREVILSNKETFRFIPESVAERVAA